MAYKKFLPAALLVFGVGVAAPVISTRQNHSEASLGPLADNDVIVSTEWLATHLGESGLVVLKVSHMPEPGDARIPGSRDLRYMDIITDRGGNSTELPEINPLKDLFEILGVSDYCHVVLYGDPVMTARAFVTLDYLGLERISVLNGGLDKWKSEHRPLGRHGARVPRGHLSPRPRPAIIATADWIMAHRE